jgi:hypothetical protein
MHLTVRTRRDEKTSSPGLSGDASTAPHAYAATITSTAAAAGAGQLCTATTIATVIELMHCYCSSQLHAGDPHMHGQMIRGALAIVRVLLLARSGTTWYHLRCGINHTVLLRGSERPYNYY